MSQGSRNYMNALSLVKHSSEGIWNNSFK